MGNITMCDKTDVKAAVKEVLLEKGSDGMTLIEREFQDETNAIIRRLTFRFGWPALVMVAVATASLVTGQIQISRNAEDVTAIVAKLDDQSAVIISRTQLEDILGVRDTKIENIEKSVEANGKKLDLLLNGHQ